MNTSSYIYIWLSEINKLEKFKEEKRLQSKSD